jgi:hypothetical protein
MIIPEIKIKFLDSKKERGQRAKFYILTCMGGGGKITKITFLRGGGGGSKNPKLHVTS